MKKENISKHMLVKRPSWDNFQLMAIAGMHEHDKYKEYKRWRRIRRFAIVNETAFNILKIRARS